MLWRNEDDETIFLVSTKHNKNKYNHEDGLISNFNNLSITKQV